MKAETKIAIAILKEWDVGRRQHGGHSTHWLDPDHDFDPDEVEKLASTIRTVITKEQHEEGNGVMG